MSFAVRVQPRASRDELRGERAGALLVRLQAAPVEGAANAALVRLLAKSLGVNPAAVTILRGGSHRSKLVRVAGVRGPQVLALAER